jgi:hypothetical protein
MKMQLQTLLLAIVLLGSCSSGRGQGDPLAELVRCQSISSDLANTLAQVAWLSQLTMIAELAQPLPKVEVAGGAYVVKDLLQSIARQAPEYEWRTEGKVIHFYSRQLKDAKFNFLNLRFSRFVMPPNLSELKLTFPTLEYGLLQGLSGGGMIIDGFGDVTLEKNSLRPATIENVTGREILIRAANESSTFFTVIVFPNSDPTRKQMELDINRNWFWQALKGQGAGPLYVQPPIDDRNGIRPPARN